MKHSSLRFTRRLPVDASSGGAPPCFAWDIRGASPAPHAARNAFGKFWCSDLKLNPILRVAAACLAFSGAAQAVEAKPPFNLFAALLALRLDAASPAAEAAAGREAVKRQLIRASWYGGGERLSGHTSTGEIFRPMGHTAAHRTLPFGTILKVTAAATGRSTIVRINDRGPAAASGRSLDLSRGAAMDLGIVATGEGRVYIEVMR
jgi:rare lipoprotein A